MPQAQAPRQAFQGSGRCRRRRFSGSGRPHPSAACPRAFPLSVARPRIRRIVNSATALGTGMPETARIISAPRRRAADRPLHCLSGRKGAGNRVKRSRISPQRRSPPPDSSKSCACPRRAAQSRAKCRARGNSHAQGRCRMNLSCICLRTAASAAGGAGVV